MVVLRPLCLCFGMMKSKRNHLQRVSILHAYRRDISCNVPYVFHTIQKYIFVLRKERKQTLETLAEAADIGLVYLGEIERGIKMPSLKTFIKLVNALDVSADELIGLETKSGRDSYTQKLSEQLQSLTQEEAAAVLSILETTIQQVKNLRNETV